MEDELPKFALWIYGLFFAASGVILIYLIIKRIKNKGKEGFEERDN